MGPKTFEQGQHKQVLFRLSQKNVVAPEGARTGATTAAKPLLEPATPATRASRASSSPQFAVPEADAAARLREPSFVDAASVLQGEPRYSPLRHSTLVRFVNDGPPDY